MSKLKTAQRVTGKPLLAAAKRHANLTLSMGVSASVAIAGLAWVGATKSFPGACLTLVGLLALMWTIHLYGRLGPDRRERTSD